MILYTHMKEKFCLGITGVEGLFEPRDLKDIVTTSCSSMALWVTELQSIFSTPIYGPGLGHNSEWKKKRALTVWNSNAISKRFNLCEFHSVEAIYNFKEPICAWRWKNNRNWKDQTASHRLPINWEQNKISEKWLCLSVWARKDGSISVAGNRPLYKTTVQF